MFTNRNYSYREYYKANYVSFLDQIFNVIKWNEIKIKLKNCIKSNEIKCNKTKWNWKKCNKIKLNGIIEMH